MSFLNKFLGDANERQIKNIQLIIDKINQLEPEFKRFSDEQIKEKTGEFKKRLKEKETLDDILPEAFALVREASKRTLNQRHFDVQLIGGVVLHQGKITEMKTGEGKTLTSTLAIYLNALIDKGVHVVTVNDYLARRDVNWMGPIYHLLGLSSACLNHQKSYSFNPQADSDQDEARLDEPARQVTIEMENLKEVFRKEAYLADITYGTNNEFGFDYLRDNMAPDLETMVQREPYFAIIDEVDSVLIDEARTPLIISMPDAESTKMYQQFSKIVLQLKENIDYNIDEKARAATLTEEGIAKVEKILGIDNIYEQGGIRHVHHLEQALKAQALFKKDSHYVVKDGQVIIVDDFTGRLMPGRRYSDGLHQAIEAKENVQVQQESRTLASVTFQNYFRMYPKLAGMTGTAITSAEEFHKVYKLEVVIVPTNKEMIRKDLPDSVYKSEKGKLQAIVREVKEKHEKGQPVLIGTVSIEKNELLSSYLKKQGITHQILNAKNHEQEAKIISQAGQREAVTVATNMAGRGVDIVLGESVVDLGGLHVIGTERHEARRIDDQLRGRAGRQGDPGSSQFFVSLEDDLMRIFGGDKVKSMMEMLKVPEDQPIGNKLVSKAIESAQGKIEGHNFDIRNHVLEYDDVMNKQRETIYKKRKEILTKKNVKSEVLEIIDNEIKKIVQFHTQAKQKEDWNYKEINEIVKSVFQSEDLEEKLKEFKNQEEISDYLIELAQEAYQKKEKEVEKENMRKIEKFVLLRSVDSLWMDHLDNMDHLRDSVRLRAYGQKDPLVEYKNEGIRLFQRLLSSIQSTVVNTIYKVSLAPASQQGVVRNQPVNTGQKVGRNDPCPCGSKKKYKKCHGK
ncbi:preprotein translocase subunit SecA [Patescibacteria group bacterium]|nr:preprotein translocase subunit SecA [Patescibacteria group bacterium]